MQVNPDQIAAAEWFIILAIIGIAVITFIPEKRR